MRLFLVTSLIGAAFTGNVALAHGHDEDGARPNQAEKHGKPGRHMGPHPHRGEMALKRIDTNGDGVVDYDEHMNHARERFKAMDLNGDNQVTAEEAREAHQAMRAKHREAMQAARKAYRESKAETAD